MRLLSFPATRDADSTPELVRIGYQPRRDPGDVFHRRQLQQQRPAGQFVLQRIAGKFVVEQFIVLLLVERVPGSSSSSP